MSEIARVRAAISRCRVYLGALPSEAKLLVHSSEDFLALLREHYGPVLMDAHPGPFKLGQDFAGTLEGIPVYAAPWLVRPGNMQLVIGSHEPRGNLIN